MARREVMDEEWIRDYLLSLRKGDEILVNNQTGSGSMWSCCQAFRVLCT